MRAQSLRGRRSGLPLLEHAQELAAGGPACADVEVPESEVRVLGVAQEDSPLQRQALAGGVGDGVAQPGVLQEGGVGEGVAAVQDDLLGAHFGHVHVDALGDAAAGPDELQAGPDPHGLRHVGGRRAGAGVLDRDSFRRGQARMRWAWEMTRLTSGSPCRGNRARAAWSLERLGQRLLPGLVDPQPGQEAKNARVAPHVLRELVVPAVGEVVEQLAALELPLHRGAREVVHDGGELAEVAEQQELDFAVHGDASDVVPQPRVQMLPRMTRPSVAASTTAAYASSHDAAVGCCLSALLGLADAPLPPQPARAARLALRFGGLGLRATDTDRHAAYWASWMDTLPVIQVRVPSAADRLLAALRDDRAARLPSLLAATQAAACLTTQGYAVPAWNEALPDLPGLHSRHDEPADFLRGWQRRASHACDERALETHLADLSPASRVLLLSQAGPHTARAFTVLPTSDDVAIPDSHFRVLLLRRLRMPLPSPPAWLAQLLLPRRPRCVRRPSSCMLHIRRARLPSITPRTRHRPRLPRSRGAGRMQCRTSRHED